MFNGYEMNFLRRNIKYQLMPIEDLIKTRYNYLIKKIDERDVKLLNVLFEKININLKTTGKEIYLGARDVNFKNRDDEIMLFQPNKSWNIEVTIQGYKISEGGKLTPIWKISDAKLY